MRLIWNGTLWVKGCSNNCIIALFEYVTNLFWDFLLVPKDAHNQTYFSFLFEPRLVLMRLSFIPASVSLQWQWSSAKTVRQHVGLDCKGQGLAVSGDAWPTHCPAQPNLCHVRPGHALASLPSHQPTVTLGHLTFWPMLQLRLPCWPKDTGQEQHDYLHSIHNTKHRWTKE